MKRLRLIQEGVLYVNPSPGHSAQSAIYPHVVAHPNGDTLAFYRTGQSLYSIDGRLAVSRLKPGGQHWVAEGPLQFEPDSTTPYNYALGIPAVHRDGSIVITATRFAATPDCIPRFNPETGGVKEGDEQAILVSHDAGRTWSVPRMMAVSREMCTSIHSPVFELPDGRWMQIIEPWKAWGDTAPLHIKGFALFSNDKGCTWRDRIDFPWGGDAGRMFSHAQYQRIPDGRIAGTQWAQSIGGQQNFSLTLAFGSPDGGRWIGVQNTGINGQSSSLAGLVGGGLVVTYTCRESARPGIYVVLDETGNGSFDLAHQVQVWDAAGRDMLGSQHAARYPASHDNVAFGKPHTAVLPDGQIISSWWCTDSSLTQCRFARLEVEDFSVKPRLGGSHQHPRAATGLDAPMTSGDARQVLAVDAHAHYGQYAINPGEMHPLKAVFHTGDAPEVARRAAEANIEWTIVSPLRALLPRGKCDTLAGNLEAAGTVREIPGLLQWVVIDPTEPASFEQAAEVLASPWCVGIKIHPESHQYPIARHGRAIFEFAAKHRAVVLAHSGDPFSLPADYVPFANEFPEMQLILAHLGHGVGGNPTLQTEAVKAGRHGNIFTDTSSANSILPGLIEWGVKEIGAERILFGTDTPLYCASMQRARIDSAQLSDGDKRKILRENAVKLLRLERFGQAPGASAHADLVGASARTP